MVSPHKLKHPPIKHLVVFSNPSTILHFTETPPADSPYREIIHAQNIIDKIKDLNETYVKEIITDKEISKVRRTILKDHQENESDIFTTYGISKNEIMTGVHCENCHHIPMTRVRASWFCNQCSASSKHGHMNAIRDYFLLINEHITNKELREFIHVPSRTTAYKMLKDLDMQGERKAAFYIYSDK